MSDFGLVIHCKGVAWRGEGGLEKMAWSLSYCRRENVRTKVRTKLRLGVVRL